MARAWVNAAKEGKGGARLWRGSFQGRIAREGMAGTGELGAEMTAGADGRGRKRAARWRAEMIVAESLYAPDVFFLNFVYWLGRGAAWRFIVA